MSHGVGECTRWVCVGRSGGTGTGERWSEAERVGVGGAGGPLAGELGTRRATSVMIRWSRVPLSHTLGAARSY